MQINQDTGFIGLNTNSDYSHHFLSQINLSELCCTRTSNFKNVECVNRKECLKKYNKNKTNILLNKTLYITGKHTFYTDPNFLFDTLPLHTQAATPEVMSSTSLPPGNANLSIVIPFPLPFLEGMR